MKKIIFIVLMFVVCLEMVFTQVVPPRTGEQVVGSGCIGECDPTIGGESATIEYKVEGNGNDRDVTMILRTTETGLCKNTGAFAFLFRNGKEVANGHISSTDDSIQTKASPGDKIVAYCITYPLFNDILCIRLGELKFVLIMKSGGRYSNCLP